MSRPSKGARLYLRSERRDKRGRVKERTTWIIRDGGRDIFTGCAKAEIDAAEQKLREYIASKYSPKRKIQDIETIPIADVLAIYADDRRDLSEGDTEEAKRFRGRILRLNDWWGAKMLSDINGEECRRYVKERGRTGGARRDLEDLRAAIGHHASEGLHRGTVKVTLPKRGPARSRWLSREEAARLLWACWRARELQRMHRGPLKGQKVETGKRPLRHLARFILIGLYTGTRAGVIASASPIPAIGRSYVDLDRGIFYRLAQGKAETNKRQPPVPIPPRLLAHLRRWKERKLIARHFVEFNGEAVSSVKTAFKRAVKLAGLLEDEGRVSPHTLRHTAATWLMQQGTDRWQAAGFLGMTVEMLDRVYGHHHPDHLQDAVQNIGYRAGQKRGPKIEQKEIVSGGIPGGMETFRKPEV
jgi:integrase